MAKTFSPTLRRLWRLIKGFLTSEVKWHAVLLLALLIGFALLIAFINVKISYINRDLFNALALKNQATFFEKLSFLIGSFLLATPVIVLYAYTEQRLGLLWRKWLSREILQRYFNQLSFYRIGWHEGIDNPDQRIEEDIRSLTTSLISLFIIIINSVLTLVMFISILWAISSQLIVSVFVYSLFGSILTFLIGKKLIALNFTQLKKEADYRYKLVNIRDNSESIAFLRGANKEYVRARQKLKDALSNFLKIIHLNLQLGFFVNIYNYLKPVIPVVIVAPLFMKGEIEFGQITQAADAFVRVVEALSVLIQHFGTVSSIAALVTRLGSFSEALENAAEETSCYFPRIQTKYDDEIKLTNVNITTPHGDQDLVKDLCITHSSGGLLIFGPSGRGKTSILRSLAGLWIFGSGEITRPKEEDCLFIPQRPYLILGTLRNQLLYGSKYSAYTDKELKSILNKVGLDNIVERAKGLDKICDWSNLLSSGEQQQLQFARILIQKPKVVFLDEATTAIDKNREKSLYTLIKNTSRAWVSIGYRESLNDYHSNFLELLPDGAYRTEKKEEEQ